MLGYFSGRSALKELVYPHERTLGTVTLVLGVLVWLALIAGTFGMALIALAVGYLIYLFAQSALISHIKGNGVQLSRQQFPDLYEQFVACCDRLQLLQRPAVYVLNGNGGLNAFATKFLGTQYVVLLSDVVDAMKKNADGVRFYIGHELGHLRMKHLSGHLLRWPVLWLPLLGAAYSRARESTCDRHGAACCSSSDNAVRALAALSAGSERWETLDIAAYSRQMEHTSGFWMSFHELIGSYPWLSKRVARIAKPDATVPDRNGLAYVLAALIPYAGRLGAGFGVIFFVYLIGVLAAVAIPAYQDYTVKAKLDNVVKETQVVRDGLAKRYESTKQIPASLPQAGLPSILPDGTRLRLNPEGMVLIASTNNGEIVFVPRAAADGHVAWSCRAGDKLKPAQLPPSCQNL